MTPLSDEDKNRVIHVGLPISKEATLLGSDNMKENENNTTFGNNFSGSKEEADRLFAALSAGGQVWMPMKEGF